MTLITRSFNDGRTHSSASYSACEGYRYALTRTWAKQNRRLLFVMLNPSKATELANDPTVERCERRARALGYGAFRVCNIFAWRETDPASLKKATAPVGPRNDAALVEAAAWADDILCAWGVHGSHLARDSVVIGILTRSGKPLLSLGVTKDGHPRHPLYVAYAMRPEPWSPSMS